MENLNLFIDYNYVINIDVIVQYQIDPAKYKSIKSGFGVLLKEQGLRGFFKGWAPTLLGYSAQGACKYGFYEFFKKYYSDIAGPEYAAKYKTLIYLAGSASAEVIADVALCPFEAVKVRVQTQPGFARGLSDGLPKIIRNEGASGYVSIALISFLSLSLFIIPFVFRMFFHRFEKLIFAGFTRDWYHFGEGRFHVSSHIKSLNAFIYIF